MNERILCIDIGTSSLKAAIIDGLGNAISFSREKLISDDFAANQWIFATENAIRKMAQPFDAICISGNGPTIVSENGRTILWNDKKANALKNELPKTTSLFLPQLAAFKTFYYEDYSKTNFLFSAPEFLIWKLTKNAVTILPEERFLPAYWTKETAQNFGIDIKKLPPFVSSGALAGYTKDSIPVFCGGPDFVTALIGTNTLKSGTICDRAGSSEGINFCVSKPIFDSQIRTLPSIIPGLWNISILIPESGSLFSAFKNEYETFCNHKFSFDELIKISIEDKNSQGWFILKGLLQNFSHSIQFLKKIAKEHAIDFPSTISITGGQANNKQWLKYKGKNAQININIKNIPDCELLGNAVLAQFGLKNFNSIQEAANKLVKTTWTSDDDVTSAINQNSGSINNETKKIIKADICKHNSSELPVFEIKDEPTLYNLTNKSKIKAIIFDIDSTLYTSPEYAFEQVDVQIRYWAKKRGISESQARTIISEYRRNWSLKNDGKKISLGNTFTNFGITIEDSIKMRENLLEPSNFLKKDNKLIKTIQALSKKYSLICVTNNPVLPARKTLQAIGIDKLIPTIIGLDTCHKSKPAKEPFEKALEILGTKPEETISIGDRYDMDLRIPLEMGMAGILVQGVHHIYSLNKLLTE